MPGSAASAVAGLVAALRTIGSDRCARVRLSEFSPNHLDVTSCALDNPECYPCIARRALAAWRERLPLREDAELVADVKHWGPPGTRTPDAEAILDAIDAALLGPRSTETKGLP